jgi:predicted acyltransferase
VSNVIITIYLAIVLVFLCRKSVLNEVYQNFIYLGIFLLILGLFFEPYEGGIKKDPSTYSYYFVCSGMAFLTIFSFILLEAGAHLKYGFKFMAKVGKNPMIAYTAGNLFLLPLLRISHLETTLNLLNENVFGGFVRGLIFTSIVSIIALIFTNKRVFWKT